MNKEALDLDTRVRSKNRLLISVLIFIVIAVIDSVLARFAAVTRSVAPGSSGLYFAVPFMIVFTLWFGVWGAAAAYIGSIVGAGLPSGLPLAVNLYWSLADLWQVLIPLAAFWIVDADVGLRTRRDWLVFLVFGWLINNQFGALWGSTMLALSGTIPWLDVLSVMPNWFIGNLIVTIVVAPPLLKWVTPWVQKAGWQRKAWLGR